VHNYLKEVWSQILFHKLTILPFDKNDSFIYTNANHYIYFCGQELIKEIL